MRPLYRNNNFEFGAITSTKTSSSITVSGTITDYKGLLTEKGFEYKAHSGSSWTTKKVTAATLSATVSSLSASTKYDFRIYGKIGTAIQYGPIEEITTEAAPEPSDD